METNGELRPTLEMLMREDDAVFIVPHNRPDFDALGASIGMALIVGKKYKKRNYIVINDDYTKLPMEMTKVIEDISTRYNVIKVGDINALLTDRSLMIAVDTSKDYLVSTKDCLDSFKDILIIDHHLPDGNTIQTPYLFIDTNISSTCEEISKLLFSLNVKISPNDANYLLAGIVLDTNKLTKNISSETFMILSKLTKLGASISAANNLFIEDYDQDRIISRMIDNTEFVRYSIAITADTDNSGRIYTIEDIAKCADYNLKFDVAASFAIAYIDQDMIRVSARSKGNLDISQIMAYLGGGGGKTSGAASIKGHKIDEVKSYLKLLLQPYNLDVLAFEEYCQSIKEEPEMKLRLNNKSKM